jgi:hypothetical protein
MNSGNTELAPGGSYMTFEQVLAELQIARSTLDLSSPSLRHLPNSNRLPNRELSKQIESSRVLGEPFHD